MLYSSQLNNSKYKKSVSGFKYSSKEYNNPFFNEKRKKPSRLFNFYISKKIKYSAYALMLLLACAAAFVLFSPYLNITEVEIIGEGANVDKGIIREVVDKNLSEKFYTVFNSKNIFIFDQDRLADELRNRYVFRQLEIKTKLPNKLIVSYTEEKYAIIYLEDEKYYYGDEFGNIIKQADVLEINQKEYPILKNNSSLRQSDQKITLDQSVIVYAISAFSVFHEKRAGDMELDYFEYNDQNNFSLKIKNGPLVYINQQNDFLSQFERLLVVKEQKLKDNFFTKEYIDLRFGESIYFR